MNGNYATAVIVAYGRHDYQATVQSLHESGLFQELLIVSDVAPHKDLPITARQMVEKGPFNKSVLINRAIQRVSTEFALISDADITWNPLSVHLLLKRAQASHGICHVAKVFEEQESHPVAGRLRPQFMREHGSRSVKIVLDGRRTRWRPGYGLLAFSVDSFRRISGYPERLAGWGWEDCDFLIRAWLAGLAVEHEGNVAHRTHATRPLHELRASRNKNVALSMASILKCYGPQCVHLSREVRKLLK